MPAKGIWICRALYAFSVAFNMISTYLWSAKDYYLTLFHATMTCAVVLIWGFFELYLNWGRR
jgi:hypothetical protein